MFTCVARTKLDEFLPTSDNAKSCLNDHNTLLPILSVSHRIATARAASLSLLDSNFADRTHFLLILYAMIAFAVTIIMPSHIMCRLLSLHSATG